MRKTFTFIAQSSRQREREKEREKERERETFQSDICKGERELVSTFVHSCVYVCVCLYETRRERRETVMTALVLFH